MARKGFDLAALAKESMGEKMSNLDIETVEMIPAARIRANEANFYEMSDLEELADSIELVGLMTPLTVKVDPDGGAGYVIIDGERRFRALTEILGRTEIPCIRKTPVNAVIEELMLIEANRTQRKMSAGELSRQAERYTELLAKLRDSGVPIPGRLRKAVAEAMQVSESKLARMHAIRKNLVPRALASFDRGEINESTAYELSRYSHGQQKVLFADRPPSARNVELEAVTHGFAPCRGTSKTSPEPTPVAAAGSVPRSSWDAEKYLAEPQEEDDNFFELLTSCADTFLRELRAVNDRREGIETLKNRFKLASSGNRACYWYGTASGLSMSGKTRLVHNITRTWTDVYDMLCTIALNRAAMSKTNISGDEDEPEAPDHPGAGGLVWHDAAAGDLPDADADAAHMIAWGDAGVKSVPGASGDSFRRAYEHWPEAYRWWAEITEPEETEG